MFLPTKLENFVRGSLRGGSHFESEPAMILHGSKFFIM